MNLNTPSEGQDTEYLDSEQTAENRFDPSYLVGEQSLRNIESPK